MSWYYKPDDGGYVVCVRAGDDEWTDRWYRSMEEAAERVSFLNGGPNPIANALLIDIAEKLRGKL